MVFVLDDFFLLLFLARKGALSKSLKTSTLALAGELFVSQQSVSRKLRELKELGFVELSSSPRGVDVSIAPLGRNKLSSTFSELKEVFLQKASKSLTGVVQSGLGEGKYYLSFPHYQKQIIEKLGFRPFLGTLNLKAKEDEIEFFRQGQKEILVEGFRTKERAFGGLKAINVKINDSVIGALVFPDRSIHKKDTAEVIAPFYLRGKLGLKDNSKVAISEVQ